MKLRKIVNYDELKKKLSKEDQIFYDTKLTTLQKHELYLKLLEGKILEEKIKAREKTAPLRKVIKRIVAGLIGTTLAAGVGIGTTRMVNDFSTRNTSNYKTYNQIVLDAKTFGADLTPAFKDSYGGKTYIYRLKNNGNQPIRVYIEEDLRDSMKVQIEQSLNYVENLFKDINNKYRFKIIESKSELNFYNMLNQTTLTYNLIDEEHGKITDSGVVVGYNRIKPQIINNDFLSKNQIFFYSGLANNTDSDKYEIALHELLHSFGLSDIHNINNMTSYQTLKPNYLDTYMHYDNRFSNLNGIFPNDYKLLQSLYNVDHLKSGVVGEMNKLKTLENINKFEEEFYNYNYNSMFLNNKKPNLTTEFLESKKFTSMMSGYVQSKKQQVNYYTELTFKDNKYAYSFYNNEGDLLETVEGRYKNFGEFVYLNNVEIKDSLKYLYENYRPSKLIANMLFVINSNYNSGEIYTPAKSFRSVTSINDKEQSIQEIFGLTKNAQTQQEPELTR